MVHWALCELRQTAAGPQTTKCTEDVLAEPRRQELAAPSAHVSRLLRWLTVVKSNHLQDSDRPPVPSTTATQKLAYSVSLPPDFFHGEGVALCCLINGTVRCSTCQYNHGHVEQGVRSASSVFPDRSFVQEIQPLAITQ